MSGEPGRSRAVFIVGPGRSGTSTVTRAVMALGVELGDDLKVATPKNPTGFFEDKALLRISKRARTALGLIAESVALVDADAFDRPEIARLQEEALETIRERFGGASLWGFKYAQTLRLLPFWQPVLARADCDVTWVLALRNPLSVARSRQKLDPLRGIQEKSDLEWMVGIVPFFRKMLGDPVVVVDYDLLMHDPKMELNRLAERLSIPLEPAAQDGIREFVDEFLVHELRHTVFEEADLDATVSPLAAEVYRWLHRLARDEITTEDEAFLEAWTDIEAALAVQEPTLRYIDHTVGQLRNARARGPSGLGLRVFRLLKRFNWVARPYRRLRRWHYEARKRRGK